MNFISRAYMRMNVTANKPEEAIRQAGDILVKTGHVDPGYVDQMVAHFHQYGPYFVIAPQIAMPHARPEDGVKQSAISLVRLKKAVPFGHQSNDPVTLVIGLAASSNREHLKLLQKISALLSNKIVTDRLLTRYALAEIEEIMSKNWK